MSSTVALAGNAFLTTVPAGAVINEKGLERWTDPKTICSIYFHVGSKAEVTIGLNASLADNTSTSTVKVTVDGNELPEVQLKGATSKPYPVGKLTVRQSGSPGYVTVTLQGVSKYGNRTWTA